MNVRRNTEQIPIIDKRKIFRWRLLYTTVLHHRNENAIAVLTEFRRLEKLRRPMSMKNLQEMIERFESTGILAVQSDIYKLFCSLTFSQFPHFPPNRRHCSQRSTMCMGTLIMTWRLKRPFSGVLRKFGGGGAISGVVLVI
ncbi:hypothetical protein AVEN_18343-1 [Araneus ventricosus]|uniref:DUF4817 domain-containing protein n=1 Tax=Araneus ventricosus TaxID=182803 RepID=A0A4Y2H9N9_ARAVE|nr:hypothetical protein AVEN_18343-1 [Araneus ventricosus]